MYCPRCGESNVEGVKYCRACGEDLSVIAQVMNRRFPVSILSKMDAYLARRNERVRRDSIVLAFSGICMTFLFLSDLRKGWNWSLALLGFMAGMCFVFSLWDFLVFKRSSAPNYSELAIPPADEALPAARNPLSITEPPSSVTERTTRHMDTAPGERQKR